VNLYYYSSPLLTVVKAKWALAKFAVGGILMGTMLLFGVAKLNQSIVNSPGSRSANSLTAENNVLRQQINLMSSRVSILEMQAGQLTERANELHMLLRRSKSVRDNMVKFTSTTEGSKIQFSMAAANNRLP
jgi:hypothetical protein